AVALVALGVDVAALTDLALRTDAAAVDVGLVAVHDLVAAGRVEVPDAPREHRDHAGQDQSASQEPPPSETERCEPQRGARPERSEARGVPTKRASTGRTSRSGRTATVAAGAGS